MEWFVPWALLVKPGLTPFPRLGCRVPLHIAAGWVAAMANLPPQPHSHAWGPAGTSALTIGDGVEPVDKSCHRTPASLSWAIILFLSLAFISYPSSPQPNSKLLGRSYPVILSQCWMDTKRCAWKISNLTSWLFSVNDRWSGAGKRKGNRCLIEK